MYGLFKMTADYYWWEDIICVSAVKENLEKYYEEEIEDGLPLFSREKSDEVRDGRVETYHYVIGAVKEI